MRVLDGPVTGTDLLFAGSSADPSAALALDLAPSLDPVLPGTLGAAVRRTVARDVAQAAVGLTSLDVGDLLTAGWQKHAQLRAAGRRTLEAPGSRETVVLAEHGVTHEAHPHVDVLLGRARLTRVAVTVRFEVDVTALAASVTEGRLVAISTGHAVLTGSLDVGGAEVARRRAELHLPVAVDLGDGLRLA